jgi:DNA-binding IclR family transcriptional regulator
MAVEPCRKSSPNLDKAALFFYTVHMGERSVQNGEQQEKEPVAGAAFDVPAPMVERAFRLLDLLVVAEEGVALSDLARSLKMSKGSIHGLLKTLESCGVIEQREDRLYTLGPRIYSLANYIWNSGLRSLAVPAMERLAAIFGETLFLGRVEMNTVRVIESVEASRERLYPHVSLPRGTRFPLLTGAAGRILLASWPVERRQSWLRTHPLPHFTEKSITDPVQFLAATEETVRTGIALDQEEYLPGVNAVMVPIVGLGGSLVAMLGVLGFSSHLKEEAMYSAGEQLKTEADIISRSFLSR